jgi:uncharacterized membrane protein
MLVLCLGLAVFIAIHSLPMFPHLRGRLIAQWGLVIYRLVHSIGAVIGLGLMAYGFSLYRASGLILVWSPPLALRHITLLLMLFAFIFALASFLPAGHIKTRLKHPLIIAIKTWALAHLLANGDAGGMVLFAALLLWAGLDRLSYRWRPIAEAPAAPAQLKWDGAALVAGLLAYGAMLHLHPLLIGVSVMG